MTQYSIMIIDDSEADRYLLKRMLKKIGIAAEDIFEADNGQTALNFLLNFSGNIEETSEKLPPNLIFLDINMPIMDGFHFLEKFAALKEENNQYNMSIIMMYTSSARPEEKDLVNNYDFVKGFIIKGDETIDDLTEVIQKYCKK